MKKHSLKSLILCVTKVLKANLKTGRLSEGSALKKQNNRSAYNSISDSEPLKLYHELQVYQIELEAQNDELFLAQENAELKEKYVNLFHYAPLAYMSLSKEGAITDLNISAANLLGKIQSKLITSRFGFFVSEDTRPTFNTFLEDVFKTEVRKTCEVSLSTASESTIHAHLVGIFEEKSNQCFLTIIDITDRKKADVIISKQHDELKKINADKLLFLSIMANDLRPSYTSIIGLSNLILKNILKFDIDKIKSYANQINQSSKEGSELLEELLTWGNAQSGKLEFNPHKLNCTRIFSEVIDRFTPLLNEKNITVDSFVEKDLEVFADSNMLLTILRNLISNAIKFTNNGGQINISAAQADSSITITVADNGIGLKLEKLFNLNEIHSTNGTQGEKGTGFGLMLCKELIEYHKGKIWAESEIGNGSKFHFSLNQTEKSNDLPKRSWKHKNILFVDDDFITNILFQDLLEDTEVQIKFAINGKKAIELCANNQFDIIIMDINMPTMNGFEATTEIRKFNSNIIIIAHTSNVLKREEFIAAGFTDYLQKKGNQKNMLKLLTENLGF